MRRYLRAVAYLLIFYINFHNLTDFYAHSANYSDTNLWLFQLYENSSNKKYSIFLVQVCSKF